MTGADKGVDPHAAYTGDGVIREEDELDENRIARAGPATSQLDIVNLEINNSKSVEARNRPFRASASLDAP